MQLAQASLDLYSQAQNRLPGVSGNVSQAGDGFGAVISGLLQASMVIAVLMVLVFLIWGAIDWISAGGDSSKVAKARSKITGSVIGLIVMASVVALFMVLQQFLGISVLNISGSGSNNVGNNPGGGNNTTGQTCSGGVAVGQSRNDGGAGHYCSNGGAAIVRCNAADSHLSYPHFDPCSCVSGNQLSGYDFDSC